MAKIIESLAYAVLMGGIAAVDALLGHWFVAGCAGFVAALAVGWVFINVRVYQLSRTRP